MIFLQIQKGLHPTRIMTVEELQKAIASAKKYPDEHVYACQYGSSRVVWLTEMKKVAPEKIESTWDMCFLDNQMVCSDLIGTIYLVERK